MSLRVGIPSIGMRAGLSLYQQYKAAAIAAAQANGAALWFAGNAADLIGNVFQDSAGTVQATDTDPIGFLKDRSNNLYSATQATAANKPTLELQANGYYGMRFDGVNDGLVANTSVPARAAHTVIVSAKSTGTLASFPGLGTAGVGGTAEVCNVFLDSGGFASAIYKNDAAASTFVAASLPGSVSQNVPLVASYSCNGTVIQGRVNGATTAATVGIPSGVYTVSTCRIGATNLSGLVYLYCLTPVEMPAPDRIAIERFAALLSGASYS